MIDEMNKMAEEQIKSDGLTAEQKFELMLSGQLSE